jgi:hypothetical protein
MIPSARPDARSPKNLAITVGEAIAERGYALLAGLTLDEFSQLAARLGPVIGQTQIRAGGGRSLLSSSAAMPFHTDGPEAELIGWWCARSARPHGESALIDTAALPRTLHSDQLDELTRTMLYRPAEEGCLDLHPCLMPKAGAFHVYYAPWHLLDNYPPEQRAALDALQEFLRAQRPVARALAEGESLFLDNGRMLHGRTAFPADSGRHLERAWIGRP